MTLALVKEDDVLTTKEAAALFGVHQATVARMVHTGILRPLKQLPGIRGARLFHRGEVTRVAVERGFRHVEVEEERVAEAG